MNLKSRYKFTNKRIDIISILFSIALIGLYIGTAVNLSLILIILSFCILILFFLYKNIIYLVVFVLLASIILSAFFFTASSKTKIYQGSFRYVGENKVFTTSKFLWFNEEFVINDNYFFKQESNTIKCSGSLSIDRLENIELNLKGIFRSVKCFGKWEFVEERSIFIDINTSLSQKFNSFNYDSSQLLRGITLGIKPTKELNVAFQQIGLSHIIVISGFNITLILTTIIQLLKKFTNKIKVIISIILVILFILIVGPTPPVIRAGFMGTIAFMSSIKWKNISYVRILLISALIMIMLDPYTIYNISFQLSFLATAGVILFAEKTGKIFSYINSTIREPFTQSIAAGVFTIPLTTTVFSTFSPALIISNILILPILSFVSLLAYLYLFLPIEILRVPLEYFSSIIIQVTLHLASYTNANMLITTDMKEMINFYFIVILVCITIYFIIKINLFYNRIEKKRIIEYYS